MLADLITLLRTEYPSSYLSKDTSMGGKGTCEALVGIGSWIGH
jgi:hypothetical protein